MALITGSLTAAAQPAEVSSFGGLEWPPLIVTPLPAADPEDLDPLGAWPTRDGVASIERLGASDPVNSPENRVAQYIESRTETLRTLVNTLAQLANLLPFYFLHRDGSAATAGGDPAPSYMRRNLDLGGFRITGMANAETAQQLATFDQYLDVLFASEDDVEQVLDNDLLRRDGTVPMAANLDLDGRRVINLLNPPTQDHHAQPKGPVDTRASAFQANYVNLVGTNGMTGDLSMQDTPSSPRFKVTNVGLPTLDSDLVNLFFLNQQVGVTGVETVAVGCILPYFALLSPLPANFLPCDGREVSRTLYPNLFAVIGTAYGAPSSSSVFKVPDLRGRVPVGLDNMGGTPAGRLTSAQASTLGGKLGLALQTLNTPNLPSHQHSVTDTVFAEGLAGAEDGAADGTVATAVLDSEAAALGTAGIGQGHQNVQPSMAINYLIRF